MIDTGKGSTNHNYKTSQKIIRRGTEHINQENWEMLLEKARFQILEKFQQKGEQMHI